MNVGLLLLVVVMLPFAALAAAGCVLRTVVAVLAVMLVGITLR